ncbi:MAG: TIM-barrel domain-containing protein, partial [Verrucomicrobiota bacterium]
MKISTVSRKWLRDGARLTVELDHCVLNVIPRSASCIQIQAKVSGQAIASRPGISVINKPEFTDWSVEENSQGLVLTTDELKLNINGETGQLSWFDGSGNTLLREAEGGRKLRTREVKRYRYDASGCVEVVKTVDGERSIGVPVDQYVDRIALNYEQQFLISENEALFGLGQHEEGHFDLRNTRQDLFQANMKSPMPVVFSTAGYGLFFDTAAVSGFESKENALRFWSECSDSLNYYFIHGPGFDEIIRSIRMLTGDAAMLPRWAFGYIQSKERYNTANELQQVADEFRRRKIPIDCLVQDWKYWPNNWWGEKSFDPSRFPDPEALLNQLHEQNLKLMISIWPNMRNDGPNQKTLRDSSLLLGDNSTYDAFSSEARKRY